MGIHEFVCIQFKGAANQGIFPLVVPYNMPRVSKSIRQSQEQCIPSTQEQAGIIFSKLKRRWAQTPIPT